MDSIREVTMRTALAVAFVIILVLPYTTFAQGMEWDRTFGGAAVESGGVVQETSDGGYIITGSTFSYGAGSSDIWLIKTDSSGNTLWDKTFGSANGEHGRGVRQTTDGGYIVVGYISDTAGYSDTWLIKTDASGNKLWDKTFGGAGWDYGWDVRQTADGGYIIVGQTSSFGAGWADVWLIKTDASGNKLWDTTFGGADNDAGSSVQQTSDGGYIVAGQTFSYGAGLYDLWLIKTDSLGSKLWDRTFGGADWDWGESVQQTVDGGYVVAGQTSSYGAGSHDVWLVKADASGNKLWDKTFGGADWDMGRSVEQTAGGGYIVTGETSSYGAGSYDAWLIKTDASGNKLWDKTFGGTEDDYGNIVQQTPDGGYIIAGETESYGAGLFDIWLIKVLGEGLSEVHLQSPADGILLSSAPTFSWVPDGGTDNVFALDLSLTPDFAAYYSTYENLHIPLHETSLTMPTPVWNMIPPGREIYWRVRGADLADPPLAIITSDEAWSFTKE